MANGYRIGVHFHTTYTDGHRSLAEATLADQMCPNHGSETLHLPQSPCNHLYLCQASSLREEMCLGDIYVDLSLNTPLNTYQLCDLHRVY